MLKPVSKPSKISCTSSKRLSTTLRREIKSAERLETSGFSEPKSEPVIKVSNEFHTSMMC